MQNLQNASNWNNCDLNFTKRLRFVNYDNQTIRVIFSRKIRMKVIFTNGDFNRFLSLHRRFPRVRPNEIETWGFWLARRAAAIPREAISDRRPIFFASLVKIKLDHPFHRLALVRSFPRSLLTAFRYWSKCNTTNLPYHGVRCFIRVARNQSVFMFY